MSKFKAGDKVVRVSDKGGAEYFDVGDSAIVTEIRPIGDSRFFVCTERNPHGGLLEERFELFKEKKVDISSTPESLRTRYLVIEADLLKLSEEIESLNQEKIKVEAEIQGLGFMFYTPEVKAPTTSKSPVLDYSDWRNWKEGDVLECIDDTGWAGEFVSGGLYTICRGDSTRLLNEYGVMSYINGYYNDFKFHSPF